jgi:large subunit ribosomal protein L23
MHAREVLIAPVVSEKSYSLIEDNKYSFRVHEKAHKTRCARPWRSSST